MERLRGKSLKKKVVIPLSVLLSVGALSVPARGQQRGTLREGEKRAKAEQVRSVSVTYRNKATVIRCMGATPGIGRSLKNGQVAFVPYGRAKARNASEKKKFSTLNKLGKAACKEVGGNPAPGGPGGTPNPGPIGGNPDIPPPQLNGLFDKYSGAFTAREARLLFERFAFGASPERIDLAVKQGIDATINSLTNFIPENTGPLNFDALEEDMACDTYISGEKNDKPNSCVTDDPNDFSNDGVRLGLYLRLVNSPNPYFYKLFLFLHDERMAGSMRAADGGERSAIKQHVELLRRAATSGNYEQFLRDWNSDHLGNLNWLDGADNKGKSPNENYAREFWELGTVGPNNLDGSPVYTDADISQAALAHSGWTVYWYEFTNSAGEKYWRGVKSYSPDLHAQGSFMIFNGTPYAASVQNAEDVLRATLAHPRTAEHLAEDIWKEFISPSYTAPAIKELAALITKHKFNLHPVMRTLMASKVMFSPEVRKSLIKHPVELIIGFLRTFPGFPLPEWQSKYWTLDSLLDQLAQRPLLPPTIFGWNEQKLASEAFVTSWRNVVETMLGRWDDFKEKTGYDFYNEVMKGVKAAPEMIEMISQRLNVTLTPEQKAQLEQYMNYQLKKCYDWRKNDAECKAGKEYYLERKMFDGSIDNKDSNTSEYKVQSLIGLLMTLAEYRMK
jgi:Protein of unknown function (DUF1800)